MVIFLKETIILYFIVQQYCTINQFPIDTTLLDDFNNALSSTWNNLIYFVCLSKSDSSWETQFSLNITSSGKASWIPFTHLMSRFWISSHWKEISLLWVYNLFLSAFLKLGIMSYSFPYPSCQKLGRLVPSGFSIHVCRIEVLL